MKNTGTIVAIVLIVMLAIVLLGGAGMMGFGGFGMMGSGMMGGYGGYGGMMGGYGFNFIGTIISFVVWALVIGGIVLLVVWLARNAASIQHVATGASSDSAIEIIKARYARGEITKDQYDEMEKVLEV